MIVAGSQSTYHETRCSEDERTNPARTIMTRAPKLEFDDGSRVFSGEPSSFVSAQTQTQVDDLFHYFEIERIAPLIRNHSFIAVQFPDNLISYMAKVLQLLQEQHPNGLVFGLNGGCCPDLVTAAHLNATLLIQYGHACLSSQGNSSIEIVHGFGQQGFRQDSCASAIKDAKVQRLLVFYSLEYAHAIQELRDQLSKQTDALILVGEIPKRKFGFSKQVASERWCGALNSNQSSCCGDTKGDRCAINSSDGVVSTKPVRPGGCNDDKVQTLDNELVIIGGLSVFNQDLDIIQDDEYSVLYLGSETNFQFMTIAMRLASQPPNHWFTINDSTGEVQPFVSKKASQLIKTRFYLIQKAKLCHVFGILVADVNRDEASIQGIIQSLQKLVQEENHVSYTFVVGSLNPAKLANFGEIDCFIWLACPEHSILQHSSTDYHVPVVTPYELLVAFERVPWGKYESQVSIDESLLAKDRATDDGDDCDDTESDVPFFSLVTGTFQQQQKLDQNVDQLKDGPNTLVGLPGNGVVSTYTSVAAERLKSREYKGLIVDKDAPVKPAVPGKIGIASSYNFAG